MRKVWLDWIVDYVSLQHVYNFPAPFILRELFFRADPERALVAGCSDLFRERVGQGSPPLSMCVLPAMVVMIWVCVLDCRCKSSRGREGRTTLQQYYQRTGAIRTAVKDYDFVSPSRGDYHDVSTSCDVPFPRRVTSCIQNIVGFR